MNVEMLRENSRELLAVKLSKSTTVALTEAEVRNNKYILITASEAITMPAASSALDGVLLVIACTHAGTGGVFSDASGYGGGAGTSFTVNQGDTIAVYCDGTYWYGMAETAPS